MPGHAYWRRALLRALPLTMTEAARDGWLVIAPHPDDEALGAGGLIAGLARTRARLSIAFLTDGAGSHVGAPGWSARRVAALRAREARASLRVLGFNKSPLSLDWEDGAPNHERSRGFERTVNRLVAMCRRERLRRVVTTWVADPHCDHQAAAAVARAVARRIGTVPLFYCVWGWTRDDLAGAIASVRSIAIASQGRRGTERRALECHRSQLGGRITGARGRFVLPRAMRRLADRRITLLLEERDAS
jgi:LmbE family N-acetylglucosaminyl deacetylase